MAETKEPHAWSLALTYHRRWKDGLIALEDEP